MEWFTPRRRAMAAGGVTVVVALAIVAPEIFTGTFSDVGTFARVVLVGALLAGWAVLARRLVQNEPAATVLATAPAVVAVALFVWPYLRPATEVDEAFPPVADVAAVDDVAAVATTEPTAADPTTPPVATAAAPATTAAPTTAVPATESATSGSTAAEAPPETTPPTPPPTTPTTTSTTVPPTTTPPTTVPAGPVELRRSGFQGLTGHRGSGDAVLYDLGDGTQLLRFEDVDIGSGPDLDVYLVPGDDRRSLDGAISVAGLTAERGNQNYDVPAGVDLRDGTWTVLVWCETFDVEVANATF